MSRPNSENGIFRSPGASASSSTDRDTPPPALDVELLLQQWSTHPEVDPRFQNLAVLFRAALGLPALAPPADPEPAATPLRQSTNASTTTSPAAEGADTELFPEDDDNDAVPVANPTPPAQPPAAGADCTGCDTYDCILAVHRNVLEVDAEAWFVNHGFFQPCCPFHGMDKLKTMRTMNRDQMTQRTRKKKRKRRRRSA